MKNNHIVRRNGSLLTVDRNGGVSPRSEPEAAYLPVLDAIKAISNRKYVASQLGNSCDYQVVFEGCSSRYIDT